MRFPYQARHVRQPVYPLGGSHSRHYPLVPVFVTGPNGGWTRDCLLDSGADDTIFPETTAHALGIDLTGAPSASATQMGATAIPYFYASVILRISDGKESCEWAAVVGFTKRPLRWPLLGQTGFLQFFDATLLGVHRETILTPNSAFSGQHTIH
ncbi:MAG TPA: hypothetical protein VMF69_16595 [Gemmataceae bacterium]|nr:hypothetical protein [Gemmataceae bacterium]